VLQQYFTLISVQNRGRGEIGRERKKNKAAQMIFLVFANFTKKISRKRCFHRKNIQVFLRKKIAKKKIRITREIPKNWKYEKKSSVRKKIAKIFIEKDSDIFTEKNHTNEFYNSKKGALLLEISTQRKWTKISPKNFLCLLQHNFWTFNANTNISSFVGRGWILKKNVNV